MSSAMHLPCVKTGFGESSIVFCNRPLFCGELWQRATHSLFASPVQMPVLLKNEISIENSVQLQPRGCRLGIGIGFVEQY